MTTKLEKYVRARLSGMSDAEAGREAGYKGRPPSRARRVYDKALMVKSTPRMVSKCIDNADVARRSLATALEWEEAASIVLTASPQETRSE